MTQEHQRLKARGIYFLRLKTRGICALRSKKSPRHATSPLMLSRVLLSIAVKPAQCSGPLPKKNFILALRFHISKQNLPPLGRTIIMPWSLHWLRRCWGKSEPPITSTVLQNCSQPEILFSAKAASSSFFFFRLSRMCFSLTECFTSRRKTWRVFAITPSHSWTKLSSESSCLCSVTFTFRRSSLITSLPKSGGACFTKHSATSVSRIWFSFLCQFSRFSSLSVVRR